MPSTITLSAVNNILIEMSPLQVVEPCEFLDCVIEIIHSYLDIYYQKFFLLDPQVDDEGTWVVFRAGTPGDFTRRMLSCGLRFQVGTAVLLDRIKLTNRDIHIYSLPMQREDCLKIELEEAQYSPRVAAPLLPDTRALLSIPLRCNDKYIGIWHISSSDGDTFEVDDIVHFQLLADQIATKLCLCGTIEAYEWKHTNRSA